MDFGNISTNIIKKGLVFNMDAANRASYPKTGTTAIDTVNNLSGSLENGITFLQPPISASCWEFDGIEDYIVCEAFPFTEETGLTVSAWIFPTAVGTSAAEAAISSDITAVSNKRAFYLALYAFSKVRWQMSTTTYNKNSLDANNTLNLNQWNNMVGTWDAVTMALYINGTLIDSESSGVANGTFSSTNNIIIGMREPSAGTPGAFPGNIANTHIYNRALSANEVLHNYNALKGRFSL